MLYYYVPDGINMLQEMLKTSLIVDFIFGRSKIAPENRLYYNYSFDCWRRLSSEHINPASFPVGTPAATQHNFASHQNSIRQKIRWLLGDEPAGAKRMMPLSRMLTKNRTYPGDYLEEVIGEPSLPASIKTMTIGRYFPLGEDLWGNIYMPAGYSCYYCTKASVSDSTDKGL